MVFYKVIDENGLIRFEEEGGARITVRREKSVAHLLSVYVPEEARKTGMGTRLLAIAEKECLRRGMSYMETAFSDEMKDLREFLTARGYQLEKGPDVIGFSQKDLLGKRAVKAMLMASRPGVEFKPFDKMDKDYLRDMYKIVDQIRAGLTWDDICTYSGALSGVLMDERKKPQVLVLCYLRKKVLTIDLVGIMPGADPELVAVAFSGIMINLIESKGVGAVSKIVGIPSGTVVKRVIERIRENGAEPQKECGTYYAGKDLLAENYDGIEEPEEELTEGMEILWHKEVYSVSNQPAIGWKVCWLKHR